MKRLTGQDFAIDESGYPCVVVKRGKGGKYQLQRILEKDVDFVKSYFESVGSEERVFEETTLIII